MLIGFLVSNLYEKAPLNAGPFLYYDLGPIYATCKIMAAMHPTDHIR